MSSDACLRCDGTLDDTELGGVDFERCNDCHGILIERPCLIPLLDRLTDELGEYIAQDGPIPPVPDDHAPAACPECGRAMQTFGYLETRTVFLDRCTPCGLLWIDPEELQTMVVMHARSTQRAAAQQAERDELNEHLSRLVWVVNRPDGRL